MLQKHRTSRFKVFQRLFTWIIRFKQLPWYPRSFMIWSPDLFNSSFNSHYLTRSGSASVPLYAFLHLKCIPHLTRWRSTVLQDNKDSASFPLRIFPDILSFFHNHILSQHTYTELLFPFCFHGNFDLFSTIILSAFFFPTALIGGLFLLDWEFLKRVEIFV